MLPLFSGSGDFCTLGIVMRIFWKRGGGRGKTVLPTDKLSKTNMAPATTRVCTVIGLRLRDNLFDIVTQ